LIAGSVIAWTVAGEIVQLAVSQQSIEIRNGSHALRVTLCVIVLGYAELVPVKRGEGTPMPIYRLLQRSTFGPEEIKCLTTAFEYTLTVLNLVDRDDPATELIARRIIEIAKLGVLDPKEICGMVVAEFGIRG